MHNINEIKDIQSALQKTTPDSCALPDVDADFAYALHIKSDGSLIIEWVTETFSHITGYDPQDIVASDILPKLIHPDDLQQAQAHINTLLNGQPNVNEFRIITKSGELHWLRDHGQPVWDETKGHVVRIYGKTQDITAQKEASEALWRSENYFHRLIESGIHLIAVLASDGTIRYANSPFEQALGHACQTIVGQSLFALMPAEDKALLQRTFAHELAQPGAISDPIEIHLQPLDGTARTMEVIAQNLSHTSPIYGIALSLRDVTHRKRP
jgi:PAS domain S-box-containing protein